MHAVDLVQHVLKLAGRKLIAAVRLTHLCGKLCIGIFEAEGLEDPLLQAEMLREFGQTSRALGNSADARLAWREAAESFEDVGAQREAAEINALLASLPA